MPRNEQQQVWTFTPCSDVETAELLEKRKFERLSHLSFDGDIMTSTSPSASTTDFFKRVGENTSSGIDRDGWTLSTINEQFDNAISAKTPKFLS